MLDIILLPSAESAAISSATPARISGLLIFIPFRLYFLSNLFPDTGREMYSIDVSGLTDLDVSVEDALAEELDLDVFPNGFRLNEEISSTCQAQLLDMSGKLVQTFQVQTGDTYSYDVNPSIYILRLNIDNKEYNRTVFVNP